MGTKHEADDSLVGTLIAGKYRVLEPLGFGLLGTVYSCRRIEDRRLVALKLPYRELATPEDFRSHFLDEIGAAAQLHQPKIVPIVEFGEDAELGMYYIVMPYVAAHDLRGVMHHAAPLTTERIRTLVSQMLEALATAHATGVVHLNLKPSNVFVQLLHDGSDRVLVSDFGCAPLATWALSATSRSGPSQPGAAQPPFGAPAYAGPERALGVDGDARSDIYSLGVILYELLTGRLPFGAASSLELARLQREASPPRPSALCRVDPRLEAVCLRAMNQAREARFQSADEMRSALWAQRARSSAARRSGAVTGPHDLALGAPPQMPQSETELSVARGHGARHHSIAPAERVVALEQARIPKRHAGLSLLAGAGLVATASLTYVHWMQPHPHEAAYDHTSPSGEHSTSATEFEPASDSNSRVRTRPQRPRRAREDSVQKMTRLPRVDDAVPNPMGDTNLTSLKPAHTPQMDAEALRMASATQAGTHREGAQPSATSQPQAPSPAASVALKAMYFRAEASDGLRDALVQHRDALLACYRAGFASDTQARPITGRLDLETNARGRIRWAHLHAAALPTTVRQCIEGVARDTRIDEAPGTKIEASVVLEFTPN